MTLIADHDSRVDAKHEVTPQQYDRYVHDQIEMHKHLADVYTGKRYAPPYSRLYQEYWNRRLCDLAQLERGSRVLDFGCGTGILLPELLRRACRGVGLDVSFDMLTAGTSRARAAARICADGGRMPFADASFDAVLCRGSIHHLPDLDVAFREIARVLEPGGKLVFSEPSNDSLINRLARRRMYAGSNEFHNEDEGLRRREILPMLREAGFVLERSRGFGLAAYTLCGFPDKVAWLNHVPLSGAVAKALIMVDRMFESLPVVGRLALHWQVRARKR